MDDYPEKNPPVSRAVLRRERERRRRTALRRSAPFFVTLGLVTVLAWLLPLRPSVSEREKRELEKFPSFSLEALLDGSYFSQIGLWFSDTFTGRDAWIAAGQELESLYGWSDVVIYGDLSAGDAIPPLDSTATPAPSPETTPVPEAENQEETTAPTATPQPTPEPYVWGGENLEDEELVTLGAVIQIGDSAYTFTGFSQYYSDAYAANITKAADLLEGKCRVFNLLVLHGTTLMLPREYREEIGCAPEEDILDYVNSKLGDNVYAVDTYDPLLWHNDEYIYFRTDHHWTALGAWYAYEEWAKMAGFEPVGLENYQEVVLEPFYGSLYYQANQSHSLLADTVYAYEPPGDVHLYLETDNRDSLTYRGFEQDVVTRVIGGDKYMCFLAGDYPLCTFVNNSITDGSACLLVKNSNGNPFAYYLTQHYQYVYVMDYRKYWHRTLTEFVDYYGVEDVLFCLSSGQAQSAGGNELLGGLIR